MLLITGATGTVGSTLTSALAGRPGVRALVRDPDAAALLERRGIEPARGSFQDGASLDAALRGVDTLFLLSPPGDADMVRDQVAVLERAVAAGVRRVVKLSSIAADEPSAPRIIAAHRAIEQHIEQSGLRWTHLRPHWFMDNELGQAGTIAEDGAFFAPDVDRISLIDSADVALAAARVLTTEGHDGRAYVLTGPEALSYGELAETYSQVLGRTVRWQEVSVDDARSSMVASGLPSGLADGFAEILERYGRGGVTAAVSPDAAQLLGRAPRSFAEFVAHHRPRFAAPAAV